MLGLVEIYGQKLSSYEVQDICRSLEGQSINVLCLRDCCLDAEDFLSLTVSLSKCKVISQLGLSLGVVKTLDQVHQLGAALWKNRSLTTLMLHGTELGRKGLGMLARALLLHPNIVTLDLGDCHLTNACIAVLADLLPANGAKRGLRELTLSSNPAITEAGWVRFFLAVSARCILQSLHLDYNRLGDHCLQCLAVALAANTTLQILDLEATGITDRGAQILLHLISTYPVHLHRILLAENEVNPEIIEAINSSLQKTEEVRIKSLSEEIRKSHVTSTDIRKLRTEKLVSQPSALGMTYVTPRYHVAPEMKKMQPRNMMVPNDKGLATKGGKPRQRANRDSVVTRTDDVVPNKTVIATTQLTSRQQDSSKKHDETAAQVGAENEISPREDSISIDKHTTSKQTCISC